MAKPRIAAMFILVLFVLSLLYPQTGVKAKRADRVCYDRNEMCQEKMINMLWELGMLGVEVYLVTSSNTLIQVRPGISLQGEVEIRGMVMNTDFPVGKNQEIMKAVNKYAMFADINEMKDWFSVMSSTGLVADPKYLILLLKDFDKCNNPPGLPAGISPLVNRNVEYPPLRMTEVPEPESTPLVYIFVISAAFIAVVLCLGLLFRHVHMQGQKMQEQTV